MVRRLFLAPALLFALLALAAAIAAPAPPDVRDAVESHLRPLVHVDGAPDEATLAERMRYYHVPAVSIAVVHEGRIVWAQACGTRSGNEPANVDTRFEAASISKPVTDVGVFSLVQQNKLDLDSDINRWLKTWHVPSNKLTSVRPPTVRTIMSHTAGFNSDSFGGYNPDKPCPTLLQVLDGIPPAQTEPVRIVYPPGEAFHYSGGGLAVLQQAVVDVTGQPFEDAMARLVLRPLHMTRSTFSQKYTDTNVARGYAYDGKPWPTRLVYPEMSAAGLRTTPTDLARLIIEVQRAKVGRGAVLDVSSAVQMLSPVQDNATTGFFLDGPAFGHDGWNYGFTCTLSASLDGNEGAVIMTNGDTGLIMYEILDAIRRCYHWPALPRPHREAIATDPAVAAAAPGDYAWDDRTQAHILQYDGRLYLRLSMAGHMDPLPPAELFAEKDGSFFSIVPSIHVAFQRDKKGAVTAILYYKDGRAIPAPRLH